jgi:ankyrin repeat protein
MNASAEAVAAIQRGDEAKLKQLIDNEPVMRYATDENGLSLIMVACYHRHPELAASLLVDDRLPDVFEAAALGKAQRLSALCREHPELVAAWSVDDFQPLHLAAFFAHPECVEVLLERHAEVNSPARNSSRVSPIHSAVAGRNREIVRLLLGHGANVNVKQHGGWTPLHAAAMHGDKVLVQLLLQHGAEPALTSDDGKTAADLAQAGGHVGIVQLLVGD